MLHTKFQGHGSIGSGEEDFLRFFTIYGMNTRMALTFEFHSTSLTHLVET